MDKILFDIHFCDYFDSCVLVPTNNVALLVWKTKLNEYKSFVKLELYKQLLASDSSNANVKIYTSINGKQYIMNCDVPCKQSDYIEFIDARVEIVFRKIEKEVIYYFYKLMCAQLLEIYKTDSDNGTKNN